MLSCASDNRVRPRYLLGDREELRGGWSRGVGSCSRSMGSKSTACLTGSDAGRGGRDALSAT